MEPGPHSEQRTEQRLGKHLSDHSEFGRAAQIAGDCHYESTVTRPAPVAALDGDLDVDVGIVGGGFAGLYSALEAAGRGLSVALIDASRIASAASGRNGGQLLPGYSCDLATLVRALGQADARRAWQLSLEGMDIVKHHAASIACEWTPGWALLAARRGHVESLREWHTILGQELDYGAHVSFVEQPDLATVTSSRVYHAALLDHRAGHLNPLKLALGLAALARARGVHLYENTPALHVVDGARPCVETPRGRLRCKHVIVAANVFSGPLIGSAARHVASVGNTMIATEPLPAALADSLMARRYAGCDTNFLLDYFRVAPDRRMIFGGASTYFRHDAGDRARALRNKMVTVFPELGGARIASAWGGLIDVTMSRAPDFGTVGERIIYLQGFSGHGLNVTALAGRLAAEAVCGERARFDLFKRLPHRNFPRPGWLQRSALSLGTLAYRMRDRFS